MLAVADADLLLEIRLASWLALNLGQSLLGRVGLTSAGKGLNHTLVANHGFFGLTLFDPGLGQGQVKEPEPIAE